MTWLLVLAAICIGALIPLQAGINASLRGVLNSSIYASITNFVIGGALLVGYALASRAPFPTLADAARAPWWQWIGGSMGAALVVAGVVLSHRLGAATFVGCFILGQLVSSVLVDHFGLVGFMPHAINPMRVLGVLLLVAGVYLIRTN